MPRSKSRVRIPFPAPTSPGPSAPQPRRESPRAAAARYRAFLNLSSEAIARLDPDPALDVNADPEAQAEHFLRRARVAECNDAYAQLYGYARAEEIEGRRRDEIATPLPRTAVLDFIRNGYRLTEYELSLVQPDGRVRWMRANVVGVVSGDGVDSVWTMLRDITRRKEAEAALTDSEERFRRLALASFEAIAITSDGVFVDGNPQLAAMLRCPVGALVGRPALDFVAPEDRHKVLGRIRAGSEEPYTHLALRADGSTFPVEVRAKAIPYQGRLARVTALRDVTEEQQAEEALRVSDARYRDIVNLSPIGIWRGNPEGRCLLANDALARLLGYERGQELVGTSVQDFVCDPMDRNLLVATYRDMVGPIETEMQLRRRDGTTFWAHLNAQGVRDGDGTLLGYEDFITDITARKAAEAAIRDSEERYRLLFEGNPVPMLVYDLETLALLDANEAALRLHGYARAELLRLKVDDLALPGDPNLEKFKAERFMARPTLVHVGRRQQRRRDGSVVEVDMTSLAITLRGRKVRLIVTRDLTAEIEGQRERAALEASLRRTETMSAMGSLVAGVAHEVRNPLFSITATVDALAGDLEQRPEFVEYSSLLRAQVGRLAQLMHDLLDYGKPAVLQRAPTRLAEVVRRAVRNCATLAGGREVRVVEEISSLMPSLDIEGARVEQAVENLVANALQHAPKGTTVRVRGWLDVSGAPPMARLAVEDEGPGIRDDDLPRLFEPFFSRRKGGTGLGLPIVQRVAEAHGGSVSAENRPEGGACFTLVLPISGTRAAG